MDKQIKDYLHLYVGCEVQYTPIGTTYKMTGLFPPPTVGEWLTLFHTNGNILCRYEEIKPILRRIEDVTESEGMILNDIEMSFHEGLHNELTYAAVTNKMLSWGIDLFGLIDAGLAIDKSTLT